MIRSKLSIKAVLVATGIGLSMAAFAGSQPAAAQSYTCPAGTYYGPVYGCPTAAVDDYDYGYYGYPTILRGQHHDHDRGFGRMGIGADGSIVYHGMGFRSIGTVGVDRGFSAAHYGGGGFAHGMGVAHVGGFGGTWAAASTAVAASAAGTAKDDV